MPCGAGSGVCGARRPPSTGSPAAAASALRSPWRSGAIKGSTSTSATSPRAVATRHSEARSGSSPTKAGVVLTAPPSDR